MQARNAVMGKIHEALVDGTLHADEAKVLEEMSKMLKESFEVRFTSVLQSEFDGQCAVDDANVGTVSSSFLQKQDFGNLSTEQMSERGGAEQEKRYWRECSLARKTSSSFEWKESLQTKLTQRDNWSWGATASLTNTVLQVTTSWMTKQLTLRTAKTMQVAVDHRVTLQAPQCSKVLDCKPSRPLATDVMYFVTIATGLLSPCQSCCNLQHVLPEHQGDRLDIWGGNARASGASDGKGSVTSCTTRRGKKDRHSRVLEWRLRWDRQRWAAREPVDCSSQRLLSGCRRWIAFNDLDLCEELFAKFQRAGKVQNTAEMVVWKRRRSQQRS